MARHPCAAGRVLVFALTEGKEGNAPHHGHVAICRARGMVRGSALQLAAAENGADIVADVVGVLLEFLALVSSIALNGGLTDGCQ